MESYQMFIDGRFVDAISGKTYRTVNPATGEEIADIALGGHGDVEAAVAAARRALPVWAATSQAERSEIIMTVAAKLQERAEEPAQLDVMDHGTPIKLGRMWNQISVKNLEYSAGAARALMGDTIPMRPNAVYALERQSVSISEGRKARDKFRF